MVLIMWILLFCVCIISGTLTVEMLGSEKRSFENSAS